MRRWKNTREEGFERIGKEVRIAMGTIRAEFRDYGAVLLVFAAAAGLGAALAEYFPRYSEVGHTPGALLVIITSALVLIGSLIVLALVACFHSRPVWLRVLLQVLLVIGLVGTGFAAWFLESNLLFAFMVVGFVGWLADVSYGNGPRRTIPVPERGVAP
ncbi:MAG: hypothetical protein ACREFJ_15965 [Acetobacteraceae bacterium]